MDESVARRLMFARYQLGAGKRELAMNTDLAAGEAVLRLHDALETFLLAVSDHVGLGRAWAEFHKYPARIEKHVGKPFHHAAVVKELNDLRLPAKHLGRYPPLRWVIDVAGRLDPVFEDNALAFLGVSFSKIRMADTITDQRTSEHVRLAETAIEAGDYLEAMKHCAVAFETFMRRFIRYGLPEEARSIELPHKLIDENNVESWLFKDPNQLAVFSRLNEEWEGARERLQLAGMGINLAEYAILQYLSPQVHLNSFGDLISAYQNHGEELRYNGPNAEFCLNFVLQTVTRLQRSAAVPDVHSFFDLKILRPTPIFTADEYPKSRGELPADYVITHATRGRGPRDMGECWIWEEKGVRLLISPGSSEITREIRRAEYWDDYHREKAYKQSTGPN